MKNLTELVKKLPEGLQFHLLKKSGKSKRNFMERIQQELDKGKTMAQVETTLLMEELQKNQ